MCGYDMGNQNRQGWNELSNALSFGGGTTRPKKRTVVKQTKEESDAMWRLMTVGEIKEIMRYMSEAHKARFTQLRESLYNTPSEDGKKVTHDGVRLLGGTQVYQEAMIILQDEKGAAQ